MQVNTQQLTQLLNSYAQIAQRQPAAIGLLNQVYQSLFSQTIQQGCGNCYQKAFYRIQKHVYLQQQNNLLNNVIMPNANRKYLLKPDRSLQTTFGGDTLTNHNLTDEVAEDLLNRFPSLLQHFEKYPVVQKAEEILEKSVAVADVVTGVIASKPAHKTKQ